MKQKTRFLFFSFVLFLSSHCLSQKRGPFKDPKFIIIPSSPISLEKELEVFNTDNLHAVYRITIGADVPNNKKPMRLMYNQETGHVFLILQKINSVTGDTIHKVFGFYPHKQQLSIFFKREVRSTIKDNSSREHDIELSRILTQEQFESVLKLSVQYSQKKYNLNTFNCYDFALKIFNSVAGTDTLPVMYRKFALFGNGGTPCTIYKYLMEQQTNAAWHPYILAGNLIAPVSTKCKERALSSTQ